MTHEAHSIRPEHAQSLRDAGWTEDQIAEAVYVIAIFAFFNRVADAFGIESMNYLQNGGPRI